MRGQIESALDYSVGSELVPKLTATLSLQSMHHVMPSVCGCHFHGLYPEYQQICEKHAKGDPFRNSFKSLSCAVMLVVNMPERGQGLTQLCSRICSEGAGSR